MSIKNEGSVYRLIGPPLAFVLAVLTVLVTIFFPEIRSALGRDDSSSEPIAEQSSAPVSSQPVPPDAESSDSDNGDPEEPTSEAPSDRVGDRRVIATPGSEDDGKGLYLIDASCHREGGSIRLYAEFLQLGSSDGRITYRTNDDEWTTDQIYSDTTPESRNFEVTGVDYPGPVKCIVDLQAQNPTYSQSVEVTSN